MTELTLSAYILVWPALSLLILVVLCRAVLKDRRLAKKEQRGLV